MRRSKLCRSDKNRSRDKPNRQDSGKIPSSYRETDKEHRCPLRKGKTRHLRGTLRSCLCRFRDRSGSIRSLENHTGSIQSPPRPARFSEFQDDYGRKDSGEADRRREDHPVLLTGTQERSLGTMSRSGKKRAKSRSRYRRPASSRLLTRT